MRATSIVRGGLLLAAALTFASCSLFGPGEPADLRVVLHGDEELNMFDGQSAALPVFVFRANEQGMQDVRDADGDRFEVLKLDGATELAGSTMDFQEATVFAGVDSSFSTTLRLENLKKFPYLVVMGRFQEPQGQDWRAIVDLRQVDTDLVLPIRCKGYKVFPATQVEAAELEVTEEPPAEEEPTEESGGDQGGGEGEGGAGEDGAR